MTISTSLYEGTTDTGVDAAALDVYRWDAIKACWVPAGLHYVGNNWESYNLKKVYDE
jgi:hypothetical protein